MNDKKMNELIDSMLDALGTAVVKGRKITNKAAAKTKDITRIAKLSIDLSTQKDVVESTYAEIGRLYYETRNEGSSPDTFAQLCEEISIAKEHILKIQAEIDALRAGEKCNKVKVACAADVDRIADAAVNPESNSDPADYGAYGSE